MFLGDRKLPQQKHRYEKVSRSMRSADRGAEKLSLLSSIELTMTRHSDIREKKREQSGGGEREREEGRRRRKKRREGRERGDEEG